MLPAADTDLRIVLACILAFVVWPAIWGFMVGVDKKERKGKK